LGVAVGEFAGFPAAGFNELIVRVAGQAEIVDVGAAAVFQSLVAWWTPL
jgi:hypothetical protein